MPADFSDYVDLIPDDISPGDIYMGAIELARLTLPEFKIRQGTPEDGLLQAAAYMSFLAVSQINRIPPRLMEGVGRIMGVTKNEGTRATVPVTITLNQSTGIDIPKGSPFYDSITFDGRENQYVYTNTSDIAIADFSGDPATVVVTLTSQAVANHPAIPSGRALTSQRVYFEIDSIVSNSGFLNGRNPDNPLDYLQRVTTHLRGLSSALAKAKQVKASLLSTYTYLRRAKVYDLTNGADWSTSTPRLLSGAADNNGYMMVFTYGSNRQLTTAEKAEVQTFVQDRSIAGLQVAVRDMDIINVKVEANVKYNSTHTSAIMSSLIKDAIVNYLSPLGYTDSLGPDGSEGFTQSNVASVIQQIPGVLYVESVTLSRADGTNSTTATSSSGTAHTLLYEITAAGNVNFLAKGLLPLVTGDANHLIVNLTAVTIS